MTSTTNITRTRVDQIRDQLTAAGEDWTHTATQIPEIAGIHPADQLTKDRCTLVAQVDHNDAAHADWSYPVTLYRDPVTATWWATGWSEASQNRVYHEYGRPYTPDEVEALRAEATREQAILLNQGYYHPDRSTGHRED